MRTRTYVECQISHIGCSYEMNATADAFDQKNMKSYVAKEPNPNYNPNNIFSPACTIHDVQRIELEDGRFAFPVYEVTQYFEDYEPWKSREGTYDIIGWAIVDEDPFEKYRES